MKSKALVQYFVLFFQIFSLLPPNTKPGLSLMHKSFQNLIFWFLCICHISIALIEFWFFYVYRVDVFHVTSTIGRVLDVFQIFPPIINHVLLIVETIVKTKTIREMWSLMEEIDCVSVKFNKKNYTFVSAFIVKFLIFFLICTVSEVALISSIYMHFPPFARSWYFRVWSINVVRIGVLQLVIYIDWLSMQLNIIANELEKIANKEIAPHNIDILKQLHLNLWKFCTLFNERFNWSLLMMLINYFICITISLYWVLVRFYFNCFDLLLRKYF